MEEQLLQTHCGESGDIRVLLVLLLLWTLGLASTPPPPQDMDILRLIQQSTWMSDPKKETWCHGPGASSVLRTVLSEWTERGEAKQLYVDITFAQQQEPQLAPLQWSFGVTVWEIILRGRTPYPGVHNYELLDLLLTGYRLKAPEDCDPKLWEVMQSCWEKQPTQRPRFRELCDRLKTLLSKLPALEACQEATYINQGLEAEAAADCLTPQSDSRKSTKEPSAVSVGAVPPPLEEDNG